MSGNDVFTFNSGSGASTISDAGGADLIKLGAGPTTSSVSYARTGNDLVITFGAGDSITVYGQFLADSSGAYTHAVEKLQYSYGYQVDLLNGINLTQSGTAGNDTMYGWTGRDALNAGDGDDVIYGGTGASMLNGAAGNDSIYGGNAGNTEYGGGGNDMIVGGTGNDLLFGDGGNDTMIGGKGNDTYAVDSAADVVTENANEGIDTVQASISYTLGANLENLTLTGTAAINGTGNALDNVITGNAAANVLDGAGGHDTLSGGAGNDTYIVNNDGVSIVEAPNGGTDTVQATVSVTLADGVENLTMIGYNSINGTGNALANYMLGNFGNNVLDGVSGKDTIVGGAGNDTIVVHPGQSSGMVTGNAGIDTIVIDVNSANVTDALRSDVSGLVSWMQDQQAMAGSMANLAAMGFSNASFTMTSMSLSVSTIEAVKVLLNGTEVSVADFINRAPDLDAAATTSALTLAHNTSAAGQVVASDWNGDAMTFSLAQGPANGTLTFTDDKGHYSYTAGNLAGSDSFTVKVDDGHGGVTMQTVSVTTTNAGPVIDTQASTSALSVAHNQAATGQVVASDANGDPLSFGIGQGPAHGTLTLTDDKGHYSYTAGDFAGSDSFTIKVDDGHGGISTQTVAVTTTNAAPVAGAVSLTGAEDKPIAGTVAASDAEGDKLNFALDSGPAHGSVSLDAATGAFTYTAAADWSGNDSFEVAVDDGHGGVTKSNVSVAVAAVADAPTLSVTSTVVVDPSQIIQAKDGGAKIVGGAGRDVILGGNGDDTLSGGGSAGKSGTVSVALDIKAALADVDGSEHLAISISGVPAGAHLSAGSLASDGSWQLTAADLDHLSLSMADNAAVTLKVTATATEDSNGDAAVTTATIGITPQAAGGGSGADEIHGGAGNDVISGGHGADLLFGDAGNDRIKGDSGNDTISGGAGNDLLQGGSGNDVLTGNAGDDTISGGEGNDTVIVGAGNQSLNGGSGFDTLDFSGMSGKVYYDGGEHDLKVYGANGAVAFTMTAVSFEKVIGSDAGNYFDTTHKAGLEFIGGAGNDLFHIEGGSQKLTGGDGSDTYQWVRKFVAETPLNGGADRITDFRVGEDHLDLSDMLKGQGIKHPTYSDVVRVHESSDGKGTMVQALANGQWHDVAKLEGVHHVTLDDLGLVDHWSQPFAS